MRPGLAILQARLLRTPPKGWGMGGGCPWQNRSTITDLRANNTLKKPGKVRITYASDLLSQRRKEILYRFLGKRRLY